MTRRAAHRFVAGERLEEALGGGSTSTATGSAASSTCSVRGSRISPARRGGRGVRDGGRGDRRPRVGRHDLDQAVPAGADGRPRGLRGEPGQDPGPGAGSSASASRSTWRRASLVADTLERLPGRRRPLSADPPGHPGVPAPNPVRPRVVGATQAAGPPGQGRVRGADRGRCGRKRRSPAQFQYLTDWLFQHGSRPAFGTHDGELIDYARQAAARRARANASSRSRCCTASAGTCSRSWPTAATGSGSTSRSARPGIRTSCAGWPNGPPTCCSSCAPWSEVDR